MSTKPCSYLAPMAALCAALVSFPGPSEAAIKFTGVAGASYFKNLTPSADSTTTNAPLTIFGGTAGDLVGSFDGGCASPGEDSTCDNCIDDASMFACNNTRIHPTLKLIIEFTSDSVNGIPTITNSNGDQSIDNLETATTVNKGELGRVVVRWGTLCSALSSTVGDCNGDISNGTIRIGMDTTSDGLLNSTGDDYKTVNIRVQQSIGQDGSGTSVHKSCNAAGTNEGVCYFEVKPGDEKVYIKDIEATNSFPLSSNNVFFRFVRLYFTSNASGFSAITPASDHQDIAVEGTDINNFELNTRKISGLTNNTTYYFSVASVDEAGNVGFFTAANFGCADNTQNCRKATPGEVQGVMSSNACFIATAAYGSPMADKVVTFRAFRDHFLLKTSLGKAFVRFYYHYGPMVAAKIAPNETLRGLSRALLWPLWLFASLSLKFGAMNASLLAATLLLLPLLALRWVRIRKQKQLGV